MTSPNDEPKTRSYKDVKPEKLDWLWPNRVPLGKLTLLVGHPGVGKSFLSLYMAAQVSTGRAWVDTFGSQKQGNVLILTAEDDPGDTVVVRLLAAGADVSNIYEIEAVKTDKGLRGLYNLTQDVPILMKAVHNIGNVRLVIIDPISAYMSGKNENKNAEVREYLNPLIELAKVKKLAIVGISHLNKNQEMTAGQRILGSTGFLAATRAAWLVETDKNDLDRKLFVPMKGNLSQKPTGLAYKLMSQSVQTDRGLTPSAYCAFEPDPIYFTADDLLQPSAGKSGRPRKKETAGGWLMAYLADGPKKVLDIYRDGEDAGFSERTLRNAKKTSKIQATQTYDPEQGKHFWEWALP